MQIAIFIACGFIIGMLIVVCLELRQLRNDIDRSEIRIRNTIMDVPGWIRSIIPNTFEYNGNKGKVYRK